MKILVTGGAGFIGSHVVDAYVSAGHDVVVVDDLSTGHRENLNPRARFHPLDIQDRRAAELLRDERPDVLNHHAAQMDVRRSVADPLLDARVNVLGTIHLLEAARQAGVARVVFVSSGDGVYAFPASPSVAGERAPLVHLMLGSRTLQPVVWADRVVLAPTRSGILFALAVQPGT